MKPHANAKLGPAGRRQLVRLMEEEGMSERQAAACLSVAPATAHRWRWRWREATREERASSAWAADRSSRPRRCPRQTPVELERRICEARRRTGWGPRLIAGELGMAHSTVHAVLRRAGCSRSPRPARDGVRLYEWPCPGDLLHVDTKRYPRFDEPGHAVTGDRSTRSRGAGYDVFHGVLDDHSRWLYGELQDDERATTVFEVMRRALDHYAAMGIEVKQVMTDGAFAYTRSRAFKALLLERGIRHIVTPPYTPRWNGKIERAHQSMEREWAKGQRYASSAARNQALPHWIAYYNQRRPHSSLGGRPPISRAHNLPGQDS